MTNYEFHLPPDDDIDQPDERDELVDRYLDERAVSYDELISQLEKLGGKLVFHDSEQLTQISAAFLAGATVEFSEPYGLPSYQPGTLTEDTLLVPLANIDRPQNLYRPHLCATIQDIHGTVDTLLFPIAKRSDGKLEVRGIQIYSID